MAIFMEVRCEGGEVDGCHSYQNAGPVTSAHESVKGVSVALAFLKSDSIYNGWVYLKVSFIARYAPKQKHGTPLALA